MIRFSRRSSPRQQAVRFLAIGVPVVTLLHHVLHRVDLFSADTSQPLNQVTATTPLLETFAPTPAPMLLSWADRMTKLEPWIKDRAAEAGQEFLGGAGFTDR